MHRTIAALIALCGGLSGAYGQTLTWIGTFPNNQSAQPLDMTPGATVLVGAGWYFISSPPGTLRPFRWTPGTGLQYLSMLGGSQAAPRRVSADGTRTVGYARQSNGLDVACMWDASGAISSLGLLPGGLGLSDARDVSADGSIVVGVSASAQGNRAFRWTQAQGMVALSPAPGYTGSMAQRISADGAVIGGYSYSASAPELATLWRNGTPQALGTLPGDAASIISFISADGSIVLGESGASMSLPSPRRAFRWTASGGMEYLFDIPDNIGMSNMSDDGSAVVVATLLWTRNRGLRPVSEIFAEHGLNLLDWPNTAAHRVSADGLTFIGNSWRPAPGGTEGQGWIATLPPTYACYANCDGSAAPPAVNVADFICFLNRFAAGESYANCDQSTSSPVLNVSDFVCFMNRFAAGCS